MKLSRQEWERRRGSGGSLQQLLRRLGRLTHLSCEAGMRAPKDNPDGPRTIPWVGPGTTLNKGRNKAKREKRTDSDTSTPSA